MAFRAVVPKSVCTSELSGELQNTDSCASSPEGEIELVWDMAELLEGLNDYQMVLICRQIWKPLN